MFRNKDTTDIKFLSHLARLLKGTVPILFLLPFDSTVIFPWLFRPELFFKKILKFLKSGFDFNKNNDFLNRNEDVNGLYCLIKINYYKKIIRDFKKLLFLRKVSCLYILFILLFLSWNIFRKVSFIVYFWDCTFWIDTPLDLNLKKKKLFFFKNDLFK